ncbi:hypothetical protein Fot_04735 [Forsythia ovata]|uniref:Uncharacterized protein n=1 Tax=Forsythia ovata TaxID=205694 RepID=A0ABD1XDE3_9LAMI
MASGIAVALQVGVNYHYRFRNLELPLPFVVQKCFPPCLRHEFSRFLSEIGSDIMAKKLLLSMVAYCISVRVCYSLISRVCFLWSGRVLLFFVVMIYGTFWSIN